MTPNHEQRKSIRNSLKDMSDSIKGLERELRGGEAVAEGVKEALYGLSGTYDAQTQLLALTEARKQIEGTYMESLRSAGEKDFSAFCEYLDPDEPPESDFHIWLCDHLMAIESGETPRMCLSVPPGHAKALKLDTPILTEKGWNSIGGLSVGDKVFSNDGTLTTVVKKSPVFKNRKTYRVITNDGYSIDADEDHLWTVKVGQDTQFRNYTTKELVALQADNKIVLPLYRSIEKDQTLWDDFDPYLKGLYFGSDQNGISLKINSDRKREIEKTLDRKGISYERRVVGSEYVIDNRHFSYFLKETYKIYNVTSNSLNWSVADRLSFIQGLMDAKGNCCPNGIITFITDNCILFRTVNKILLSLGVTNISASEQSSGYYAMSFSFADAFTIPSMVKRAKKGIVTERTIHIEPVENSDVQCITVCRPNGLFLAGEGLMVTHNSTYASRKFSAWYLGKNPTHRYIQAGHTQGFCENEFGKKTRAIIDSSRYQDIFPEIALAVDSKAAGYWSIANFQGSYLARGVGQGLSGFRSHCAGVDDPFATREDAESKTIRQKVFDWFSADFTTRLLPNRPMFVVATRWHTDDLIGRIEKMSKEGRGLPWEIINLPALCENPEDDPLGRIENEPLWPNFYDHSTLFNLKATLPARDWNSLYRGQPVDATGDVISVAWFPRYLERPPKDQVKRTVISVDTANKPNERADYTALGVFQETKDGQHYLLHVIRKRVAFNDLCTTIENAAMAWNADVILVEDKGSGTQYIQARRPPGSLGVANCPVIPIATNNDSKEFRMDGVTPMMEAGNMWLPESASWLPEYEAELTAFPTGKNDDQCDMTSQYLNWVRKKGSVGSKKLGGAGTNNGASRKSSKAGFNKNRVLEEIETQLKRMQDDPEYGRQKIG